MGEAMITRWRENRLGGRGGDVPGRGTFLKKGSPPGPPPSPKALTGGEVARREFVPAKI